MNYLAILILFLVPSSMAKNLIIDDDVPVCTSEQCEVAALRLFKNMNTSADPCDDFEQFACGQFQQDAQIPEDKSSYSVFTSELPDTIFKRGRKLLEAEDQDEDWELFRTAKKLYRSCMDLDHLEELGVKPMLDSLKHLGGWPVLEGDEWNYWRIIKYQWWEQVYRASQGGFGINNIIKLAVETNGKDSSKRSIIVDQPSLGLDREFLVKGLDEPYVQHYFSYMKSAAKLMGAPQNDRTEKELRDALLFEIELANISDAQEDRRNDTELYNPIILEELKVLDGHPPSWVEYVNKMVSGSRVPNDEVVIVKNPMYLRKLATIMKTADARTVSNYLMWRAVKSKMSDLNRQAGKIREKFNKEVSGINSDPPRWKKCAKEVGFETYKDNSLRVVASSMYIQKFFVPEAKVEMLEMITNIKSAFKKVVEEVNWMEPLTKTRALKKLEVMNNMIGYPDELTNEDIVTEHHSGLVIKKGDFYGNKLRLSTWNTLYELSRLREKVDKMDWRDNSLVPIVNAFYAWEKNAMIFPAGILQGVFFNHQRPRYLNYGAIGVVIGHEITHGFDDQGRLYNEDGNLNDWWEKATAEEYIRRAKCIVDQYSNYFVEQAGLNLKGKRNQGENIADNGGIKEAYMAYTQWASGNAREKSLPGFESFTPQQMFWVSYGQVWCIKYRDAALKSAIETAPHSPGKYRILGPLSNIEHFARDFNCPVGSGMNPEKKCEVW